MIFVFSCEKRRNCKGVKGHLEFNENIIELIEPNYCIGYGNIDLPIVIIDSVQLKEYLNTDPTYCNNAGNFDFSNYSILTFSTKFSCKGMGIRFELLDNGNDSYFLNIYKCGRKYCFHKPYVTGEYVFKIKKLNNTNLKYNICE